MVGDMNGAGGCIGNARGAYLIIHNKYFTSARAGDIIYRVKGRVPPRKASVKYARGKI